MGRVYKRKGQDWHYVRLYWQGKYLTFSHYHGERMTEKTAVKLLGQIQGDIERKVFNALKYKQGQSPVSEYLHEWMAVCESSWAVGTRKAYSSYIRNHLEPFFEENRVVVQEVRKQILDRLRLWLMGERKLTGQTAWHIINGCLRSCLHHAWESELIDHMPPFPRRKEYTIPQHTVKYVTRDVQSAILDAIPSEHRPVFLWLSLHLRRPSEAMGLRREDFDPVRRIFTLRHGVSGRQDVDHTKTRTEDEIPCHGDYRAILEGMRHEYPFSPYMFTCKTSRQKGNRYTHTILRNIWLEACKKVGVSLTLYQGTKHSTAQGYLDDGYSFEQLRVVTGHTSLASVKHYASATVEIRRGLMERKVVPLRKAENS